MNVQERKLTQRGEKHKIQLGSGKLNEMNDTDASSIVEKAIIYGSEEQSGKDGGVQNNEPRTL